jgi:hypothetical protein
MAAFENAVDCFGSIVAVSMPSIAQQGIVITLITVSLARRDTGHDEYEIPIRRRDPTIAPPKDSQIHVCGSCNVLLCDETNTFRHWIGCQKENVIRSKSDFVSSTTKESQENFSGR